MEDCIDGSKVLCILSAISVLVSIPSYTEWNKDTINNESKSSNYRDGNMVLSWR